MLSAKEIKKYKKGFDYSYTLGAFSTIELLQAKPEQVISVFYSPSYQDQQGIIQLCHQHTIPVSESAALFRRISPKESCMVLGIIRKYTQSLEAEKPHVMLVNPSDMGNLGTIIRTIAGFGITNLAVITPAADIWNPKTIRASMGALFRIQIEQFSSFTEYQASFSSHTFYPFLLDGKELLQLQPAQIPNLFTLIFGNEASGLPAEFQSIGTSIKIPQSELVDSLNLANAVAIGSFVFSSAAGILSKIN